MSRQKEIIAIVGPTASGKTTLAVDLAERTSGEIVSADSRQVYRLLTVGTAKPSREEMQRVRHHFIDILNPDELYSAGQFGAQARKRITDLLHEGKTVVVAGGSGLYVRALVDGLFEEGTKEFEVRGQLEERLKAAGPTPLFEELRRVDPLSADRMDRTNVRRVLRALEVYYTTGKPISLHHAEQRSATPFAVVQIGVEWDRQELYRRIDHRVDRMMTEGLENEVENLQSLGFDRRLNALNTVGYREMFDYLEGKIKKETAIELIKRNTRRFAKRQLTWFRADKRIEWIAVREDSELEKVAQRLAG